MGIKVDSEDGRWLAFEQGVMLPDRVFVLGPAGLCMEFDGITLVAALLSLGLARDI